MWYNAGMKALVETLQQVALGLFVNGTYGLMQGDIDFQNILIVIVTTKAMYMLNRIKGGL